jgi:IS1 family transposase
VHGLKTKRVQCDEIWAFCYAKAKNVPAGKQGTFGDVWTWNDIDADSKLCVTWLVGDRSARCGTAFMNDTAWRIENRLQLTTDGHAAYFTSVDAAFATDVDYAMLHKVYAAERAGEARYSPPICVGCETKIVSGDPDREHISTSYVERQNLTMRMSMRRFTRLTNGFSKKVDNLAAAVALHFVWYNFGRVHQTLRKTPAMAAGIASHVWTVEELIALLDKKDSN